MPAFRSSVWMRLALVVVSLGFVAGIGAAEYATRFRVSLVLFYLVPVVLTTWGAGRALGVLVACASAAAWGRGFFLTGRALEVHWVVPLWNGAMLAFFFCMAVALTAAVRRRQASLVETAGQRTENLLAEVAVRRQAEENLRASNAELTSTRDQLERSLEDLRRSHEQEQAAQFQLIESAKMDSIGRLAAGIAHEVKNPLMTLSLGADYFVARVPADSREARLLADMREAVERAGSTVNLLLDFSRPHPLRPEPGDLNEVVERALQLVRHTFIRLHVQVARELADGLPPVPLDRMRLEQVLVNLFLNSADAMSPGGGTLTVRTRVPGPAADGSPPMAAVEIDDTGPGVPAEHLPMLFEPFYTTKPVGQGTGLGLAVARRIVQNHAGELSAGLAPGGGARFTIRLPVATKPLPIPSLPCLPSAPSASSSSMMSLPSPSASR